MASDSFELSEPFILDQFMYDLDSDIEKWMVEHLNKMSVADFRQLLYDSGSVFSYLQVLLRYDFEVIEGMEDSAILKFSRVSTNELYIVYQFNFRRCGIDFVIAAEDFLPGRERSANIHYQDVHVGHKEVTFWKYCRPAFEISFILNTVSKTFYNTELVSMKFM